MRKGTNNGAVFTANVRSSKVYENTRDNLSRDIFKRRRRPYISDVAGERKKKLPIAAKSASLGDAPGRRGGRPCVVNGRRSFHINYFFALFIGRATTPRYHRCFPWFPPIVSTGSPVLLSRLFYAILRRDACRQKCDRAFISARLSDYYANRPIVVK